MARKVSCIHFHMKLCMNSLSLSLFSSCRFVAVLVSLLLLLLSTLFDGVCIHECESLFFIHFFLRDYALLLLLLLLLFRGYSSIYLYRLLFFSYTGYCCCCRIFCIKPTQGPTTFTTRTHTYQFMCINAI